MKEVLIYGALVAAVIGSSIPVIQGLTSSMDSSGQQMNQSVQDKMDEILTINSGS